jgi:hypothetical protein
MNGFKISFANLQFRNFEEGQQDVTLKEKI